MCPLTTRQVLRLLDLIRRHTNGAMGRRQRPSHQACGLRAAGLTPAILVAPGANTRNQKPLVRLLNVVNALLERLQTPSGRLLQQRVKLAT